MIGLFLKDYYLYSNMSAKHCAYCEAVDDAVIKALGTMIWVSMPESVKEICYGCRGVTDEEGRPKFYFIFILC